MLYLKLAKADHSIDLTKFCNRSTARDYRVDKKDLARLIADDDDSEEDDEEEDEEEEEDEGQDDEEDAEEEVRGSHWR